MRKGHVVLILVRKSNKRIRSFIPILIPLFASSFKRADALAIAMEARGYKGGEGRTRYRTLQWGVKDTPGIARYSVPHVDSFLSKKWIELVVLVQNKEKALYKALFTLNSHILVTFVIYSTINCNILCV